MTTVFKITTFFLITVAFCSGQTKTLDIKDCDVELRFDINRNSTMNFYDSTGATSWTWSNDSLDYIYAYFNANSSVDHLVKLTSVIFIHGENQDNLDSKEFDHNKPRLGHLEGSWIKLADCEAELNEWMSYGDYNDTFTPYIFESPDSNSTKTKFDPRNYWAQYKIELLDVQGSWFRVRLTLGETKLVGWMPSFSLCSHPRGNILY